MKRGTVRREEGDSDHNAEGGLATRIAKRIRGWLDGALLYRVPESIRNAAVESIDASNIPPIYTLTNDTFELVANALLLAVNAMASSNETKKKEEAPDLVRAYSKLASISKPIAALLENAPVWKALAMLEFNNTLWWDSSTLGASTYAHVTRNHNHYMTLVMETHRAYLKAIAMQSDKDEDWRTYKRLIEYGRRQFDIIWQDGVPNADLARELSIEFRQTIRELPVAPSTKKKKATISFDRAISMDRTPAQHFVYCNESPYVYVVSQGHLINASVLAASRTTRDLTSPYLEGLDPSTSKCCMIAHIKVDGREAHTDIVCAILDHAWGGVRLAMFRIMGEPGEPGFSMTLIPNVLDTGPLASPTVGDRKGQLLTLPYSGATVIQCIGITGNRDRLWLMVAPDLGHPDVLEIKETYDEHDGSDGYYLISLRFDPTKQRYVYEADVFMYTGEEEDRESMLKRRTANMPFNTASHVFASHFHTGVVYAIAPSTSMEHEMSLFVYALNDDDNDNDDDDRVISCKWEEPLTQLHVDKTGEARFWAELRRGRIVTVKMDTDHNQVSYEAINESDILNYAFATPQYRDAYELPEYVGYHKLPRLQSTATMGSIPHNACHGAIDGNRLVIYEDSPYFDDEYFLKDGHPQVLYVGIGEHANRVVAYDQSHPMSIPVDELNLRRSDRFKHTKALACHEGNIYKIVETARHKFIVVESLLGEGASNAIGYYLGMWERILSSSPLLLPPSPSPRPITSQKIILSWRHPRSSTPNNTTRSSPSSSHPPSTAQ